MRRPERARQLIGFGIVLEFQRNQESPFVGLRLPFGAASGADGHGHNERVFGGVGDGRHALHFSTERRLDEFHLAVTLGDFHHVIARLDARKRLGKLREKFVGPTARRQHGWE